MKIYIKKIDDTLVPEFIEINLKTLIKKINKIPLENIYIIIDDINELNYLEKI